MSDFTVRVLTDDDWALYRTFRLASLEESPDAFTASLEEEQGFGEDVWRDRMRRATRLLAEKGSDVAGVASVRRTEREDDDRDLAEFFGMWVDPETRGKGVGVQLMRAAVAIARSMGSEVLVYWVSTDNGPAVAFASSYGFRTTDSRRPMKNAADEDDEEMLMLLPLADDPAEVASTTIHD